MMGSKAFLFLGLILAIFAMISSEVVARELTENSVKVDNKNVKVEHGDEQYPSGGYKGYGEYNGYKSSGDTYKNIPMTNITMVTNLLMMDINIHTMNIATDTNPSMVNINSHMTLNLQ
ncbi:glycine-rich protein-like isoform X1 [Capsicum chacoense]